MGPMAATQGAVDTYHPTDWRGKGAARWAAEAEIAGFGARRCGRESKGPAVPHRTIVPLAGGRATGPAATDGQNRAAVEEPEVGHWA